MSNRISRAGQTGVYTKKFFGLFWNDKSWKSIIFSILISGILCLVLEEGTFKYWLSTQSGCFTIVSACIWIGIFNSIQSVCKERAILKREHRSGLHMSSYIFALMIYHSVICLVQSILMTATYAIFMKHFPSEGIIIGSAFIEMLITFFIITYSADLLGLAISSIVKTTTTAMTVMPFVLIFQLVLSGTSFELTGGAKTAANFAISKWGMQAVGSIGGMEDGNMFSSAKSEKNAYDNYEKSGNDPDYFPSKKKVYLGGLSCMNYDATPSHLLGCWGLMILFGLASSGVAIVSLEFIDKDKR